MRITKHESSSYNFFAAVISGAEEGRRLKRRCWQQQLIFIPLVSRPLPTHKTFCFFCLFLCPTLCARGTSRRKSARQGATGTAKTGWPRVGQRTAHLHPPAASRSIRSAGRLICIKRGEPLGGMREGINSSLGGREEATGFTLTSQLFSTNCCQTKPSYLL